MSDLTKKVALGEATEADYLKYFINKNAELETDYSNLVYGIRTKIGRGWRRAGYERLRDFYDGDQWLYIPESGKSQTVYNYLRGVVMNYTSFMTNEPLDIDVPPRDITDEIEVARSEAKEKFLKDILDDNEFEIQFEEAVQNGSLLGDSIILGPFYDTEKKRIWIQNIKKPENVKIIWKDDSFSDIFGFIHNYFISPEKAYEMFPEAKGQGILFQEEMITESSTSGSSEATGRGYYTTGVTTGRRMVRVMDCWTEDVHHLIVGDQTLEFEEHNWGFVPITYVPNIVHPVEPNGVSDLEDLLDTQVEINERSSDMSEVISQTAFPYIFGKNLDPVEIQSGTMNLIDIGDEAEIVPDPRRGQAGFLSNEITRRLSSFYQLSGLNENIFGGQGVRAVTGRALSVLMQTVNNRIKSRQARWTVSLQKMFANIFILAEEYSSKAKELIDGYYKTDIFFPGTLLRNITDEINKFNAKLQSQETTMKNLGVPSPKDEQKLMKKELKDQMMMVEISRNPGLQLQIHQMLQQQLAQQMAGQDPQLREDENMEEQPMAQGGAPQQSAVSAQGAVNQANQRSGASVAEEGGAE